MSYQKMIAFGRITKDIELKQSKAGKPFCNFSIAVNRAFEKDKADFFQCMAFGKTAEYIDKYASKGSQILIEGSVQIDEYEGKYYTKIMVQQASLIGNRQDQNAQSNQAEVHVEEFEEVKEEPKKSVARIKRELAEKKNEFEVNEEDMPF
jgi:single-strand DNA-binding protein